MASDSSSTFRTSNNRIHAHGQFESDENGFEVSSNSFPINRTPLNCIPDPTQFLSDASQAASNFDSDNNNNNKGTENWSGNIHATPRVSGRGGKVGSGVLEPNSVSSTPIRSVPKLVNSGALGACAGSRVSFYNGTGKGGNYPRAVRGASAVASAAATDSVVTVPHFELEEDPSFWTDHNVQVLIRIRPISTLESASQGQGRCLKQESAQSLLWLGHPETRFTFDHVACETISQQKLFKVAGLPMLENCMSGYNSCMFAYGQTGSGKTYTMMGDIHETEHMLNEDCGITPRIFEYLFTRIREEEEKRKDEKLKYCCKCSFLEIYNEQITDLLEPSSINLQLREDLKKGVYVENLTERSVTTVSEVIELLAQGATNRKVASTYMNSESSRSHSVFTCTIESHWEKDSMNHIRFGRLNLVDLAGSERQKTSGAEGDRLKEAANINKSLSTLGLVIMSLVDMAQGKQRHVPYRDSRLTFLLQDSLGGNSKTMIIANCSPSICSANETLSTLKFAQRSKLIQNNAKVNEDASGDVPALQRQVHMLKDQLSLLLKNQNLPKFAAHHVTIPEESLQDNHRTNIVEVQHKKIARLEATLAGALRREKLAETEIHKLEAEIEHLNRLAQQRDEDAQRTKMMLRFREEKIKRLELLRDGPLCAEEHHLQEKGVLLEEINTLRTKIDRNPEVTRFALENIRLLEQLQQFQDFYENGEREKLLAEISDLRDQLLDTIDLLIKSSKSKELQDPNGVKAFTDCKDMNSRLMREFNSIQKELERNDSSDQSTLNSVTSVKVKTDFLADEMLSDDKPENGSDSDKILGSATEVQSITVYKELEDAKLLIHELESQQLRLIEELGTLQDENQRFLLIFNKEKAATSLEHDAEDYSSSAGAGQKGREVFSGTNQDTVITLQNKLDTMSKELEQTIQMNSQRQEGQALELSRKNQVDSVFEEVEMETARTILQLQDEVATLQSELQDRLSCMASENKDLKEKLAAKDAEMKESQMEWERATIELTSFLIDGSHSLRDVSEQIDDIIYSFPQVDAWISEQVKKAAEVCIEKEETILLLQKHLENAQNLLREIETKISSLRGATFALNGMEEHDEDERVAELMHQIKAELVETNEKLSLMENSVRCLSLVCCTPDNSDLVESESGTASSTASIASDTDVEVSSGDSGNGEVGVHHSGTSPSLSDKVRPKSLKMPIQESDKLNLEQEVRQIFDSFKKICSKLSVIFGEKFEASLNAQGEKKLLQSTKRKRARTGCHDFEEMSLQLRVERGIESTTIFLAKFEEAQSTIKEADYMLNALVNANEKSKQLTTMWRQAGNDLMAEKASLLDEVEKLKNSVALQDKENAHFQEELQHCFIELGQMMSMLETSFMEVQMDVEEQFKAMFSDVCSMVQGLMGSISSLRPLLEGKSIQILKEDCAVYMPQECHTDGIDKICANPVVANLGKCPTCVTSNNNRMKQRSIQQIELWQSQLNRCLPDREEADKHVDFVQKNSEEVDRKIGLLFDFGLPQESASKSKDMKDENQNLVFALSNVQKELEFKSTQLDSMLLKHNNLENQLAAKENSFSLISSDLEQAKEMIDILSAQNAELGALIEELYTKKSELEEELKDKKETVGSLEKEVLCLSDSTEKSFLPSVEGVEDMLRESADEKCILTAEIEQLKNKLDMAYALADENEALAIEARHESEASKIYAEQKEEEVQILECSVEELESTVNVLEKKVFEMEEEVKRQLSIRDSLEQEIKQRMLTVETLTENMKPEHVINNPTHFGIVRIEVLEKERTRQENEIKQLKEYIAELVLHAEAQASQYQQKYKTLEAMVREVKSDSLKTVSTVPPLNGTDKLSTRTRGSSSPFKCISSLVHQMNTEKDQELSSARLHIEELESLTSMQKKEVCKLNSRLAAAESMTHDVIRDLLGVKLDITNYVNVIDQHEVHQLLEVAHQQTEEALEKEQEILILRKQIGDLIEERESLISESNKRRADILAAQMKTEQFQEEKLWLVAQNTMLQTDKKNLKRKVSELDDMVKRLSVQNSQQRVQQPTRIQGSISSRYRETNFTKSVAQSERSLSRINDELAQYRRMSASSSRDHGQTNRQSTGTNFRN